MLRVISMSTGGPGLWTPSSPSGITECAGGWEELHPARTAVHQTVRATLMPAGSSWVSPWDRNGDGYVSDHLLKALTADKTGIFFLQSSNGTIWRQWKLCPKSGPWLPGCCEARLGLPPQIHHCHGDGISDVCRRRTPLSTAVTGGGWSTALRGFGVHVYRATVCCDGAGVDPHPEGEAEAEALQSWDLTSQLKWLWMWIFQPL